MTSFARNEIISATQAVRQFSALLTQLKQHDVEKVGIIRNNEMEAVIIPVEEYEFLRNCAEKKNKKTIRDYFGTLDSESADEMEVALKDCRKVDLNEW